MSFAEKIIVALDTQDDKQFDYLINNFKQEVKFVKVGMELFYTKGPEVIHQLKDLGFKIFLDLKLHDIPNTVKQAVKTLTKLEVDLINLHTLGGINMMKAAIEGREAANIKNSPKLIGVTILTSHDEVSLSQNIFYSGKLTDIAGALALNAFESGLDGVVCSPFESELIKEKTTSQFLTVCPGVRPRGSSHHDQRRVMTPNQAAKTNCDYYVIGRAITNSQNPQQSFLDITQEMDNA